ncbi:hypothetical protein QE152_g9054 [Popillia japonica]|uniref:Uncharacterized protein n=1 Tax=Popillia japonica TaxID=7064 RepID=A0AAW1LW29_POPJA
MPMDKFINSTGELDDILTMLGTKKQSQQPTNSLSPKPEPSRPPEVQKSIHSGSLHSNTNEEPRTTIPITEMPIDTQKIQIFIEDHIYPAEVFFDTDNGKMIYQAKVNKERMAEDLLQLVKDIMIQLP